MQILFLSSQLHHNKYLTFLQHLTVPEAFTHRVSSISQHPMRQVFFKCEKIEIQRDYKSSSPKSHDCYAEARTPIQLWVCLLFLFVGVCFFGFCEFFLLLFVSLFVFSKTDAFTITSKWPQFKKRHDKNPCTWFMGI